MFKMKITGSVTAMAADARKVQATIVPSAVSSALTKAAKAAQSAVVETMPRVFDNPTRYALNGLHVVPATVNTLRAQLAAKHVGGNNATPADHFLAPNVLGGRRNEKRFERAFLYAGVLTPKLMAITARSTELQDAHGNLPSSVLTQLISYFGGFQEQGYRANMTAKRKGQLAKKGRTERGHKTINGVEYFASFGPGERNGRRQHLHAGIYRRRGIHGVDIAPVLIFGRPRNGYRRRLNVQAIAEETSARRMEAEFKASLAILLNRR